MILLIIVLDNVHAERPLPRVNASKLAFFHYYDVAMLRNRRLSLAHV